MKNFKLRIIIYTTISFVIFLSSCDKKEENVNPAIENEAITTVQLKLKNTTNPSDTLTAQWEQLLDAKGNPLPADTSKAILHLKSNVIYTCQFYVLDKTQNPVADISDEITERGIYHLLFYQPTPISTDKLIISDTTTNIPGTVPSTGPYLNLNVKRTDRDNNTPALGIGVTTLFITGNASSGRLRVVLRHQPDAKNGTYAPGQSDVDVSYSVVIAE